MRIYGPFPQFSFVITVSFNLKEITPRLIRERIEVFGTEYLIEEIAITHGKKWDIRPKAEFSMMRNSFAPQAELNIEDESGPPMRVKVTISLSPFVQAFIVKFCIDVLMIQLFFIWLCLRGDLSLSIWQLLIPSAAISAIVMLFGLFYRNSVKNFANQIVHALETNIRIRKLRIYHH